MNFKPYDYQVGMVDHLVRTDHAALFVEMGLGKTICTLEALRRVCGKALVIAPLRVANMVWSDQVAEWELPFKVANLRTAEGKQAWEDGSADIYTLNYELISRGILDKLITKDIPADTLIIDELSMCKSNSKRTRSIVKARKSFKRVWGLTGTPSSNGLLDLFYQMKCIDGGKRFGNSVVRFREKFFDSDYMGWTFVPKPTAAKDIQNLIKDLCLVRKSEDHLDIPDAEVVDINVKLPAKVMRQYKELQKKLVIEIEDDVVDAQSAAVLVNKLQQFTAGHVYTDDGESLALHTAKYKPLGKVLDKHTPVLVLTRYKSEMSALLEAFPQAEKFDEKRMDDWVAGRIPVWIANAASISHGIDRIQHSCSTIVWMSLTYSLEQYAQTNARILRTGQKNPPHIYRIMCEETVDWAVASALETKDKGQATLLQALSTLQRTVSKVSRPS